MEIKNAKLLIESMLERIETDGVSGKSKLGVISSKEIMALECLLVSLEGELIEKPGPTTGGTKVIKHNTEVKTDLPIIDETKSLKDIELNLNSLKLSDPQNPEVIMCLDFGTAMSKAFAIENGSHPIELALGKRAGKGQYPVDSSLFISDDGILYFGPQAVELGTAAAAVGRKRFDSFKSRLSMGQPVDTYRAMVNQEINPHTDIPMSEGELITLYLAYLTDLATSELEAQEKSRYCLRRFARPCWSAERNEWAEPLLKKMLAQAQILADTFQNKWQNGIPLTEAKLAMDKVVKLRDLPNYLIGDGIPEPVAAAANLVLSEEDAQREMFLVIDVGAGTTDFGLFLLQRNLNRNICIVHIVPQTIKVLEQAGNRVDDMLKFYVLELAAVDRGSQEGQHDLSFLQSTIRLQKETLFRKGQVEVPLANGLKITVELGAFLQSIHIVRFSELLKNYLLEVLNAAGNGFLEFMSMYNLKVVLTGGS